MPQDEPVSRPPPHEASYPEQRLLSYKDEVLDPHGEERVGVYHRAALRADPLARLEP